MSDSKRVFSVTCIDDDPNTIELMTLICSRRTDIKLTTFINPVKAYSALKHLIDNNNSPDIVVIDRKMPYLPGEQLNVMLKHLDPDLFSVLYTSENNNTILKYDKSIYKFDHTYIKCGRMMINEIIDDIIKNKLTKENA
jgi:DNA-binding NtrC family response regulator